MNQLPGRLRMYVTWRLNGVRATVRSLWRLRGWDRSQRVTVRIPDNNRITVIFCTWRRLARLPHTLEMLADQTVQVQALIWDNSDQSEVVDKAVAEARIPVTVHHNRRNIGGFGRFYLARAAAEAGVQTVVFIDDDLEFGPAFVADLLRAHRPRALSGWFAFTEYDTNSDTWALPGAPAVYIGTGGMIADASVFLVPRVFSCPRHYWFLEDVWLSHVASRAGYDLYRNPAPWAEVHDGRNQSLSLGWLRKRMFRELGLPV
jgi:glycosyltransferase involved in cell wall biosynthesis